MDQSIIHRVHELEELLLTSSHTIQSRSQLFFFLLKKIDKLILKLVWKC